VENILEQLGIPESYGHSPALPRFAEPEELVDVGPNIIGRVQRLTPATARAWADMTTAAAADSIELLIVSGFRSIDDQARLIWNKLCAGQAIDAILKVNTAPGFSQHHTGQAIDIATPSVRPLTEAFNESPAFQWLDTHAESFGFRMPYGYNNEWDLTYEPWHWFLTEELER
jgi:D-alanyl-D-alanine carboxypeptidase